MLLSPSFGVSAIGSLKSKNRFNPTQINGLSHTQPFTSVLDWDERKDRQIQGATHLYNKPKKYNNIKFPEMFSIVSGKVLHEFSCWWFAPGPFSVNCHHLFREELWTRFWQVVTTLRTLDRAPSICTDSNLTTSKEKEMRELSFMQNTSTVHQIQMIRKARVKPFGEKWKVQDIHFSWFEFHPG